MDLKDVVLKAVWNIKKRNLDNVELSRSHHPGNGINLSEISEDELFDYVSKISNAVFFHNIRQARGNWYKINGFFKPIINASLIEIAKLMIYMPGFDKNDIYRSIGIKLGKDTTVAPRVQFDYFHPELIEIGDNCLIGDNVKLWTHSYGLDSLALGPIKIGNNVNIGSESIIGPATHIEDDVMLNFGSFLYATRVPKNSKVRGKDKSIFKHEIPQKSK